MRRLKTAGKILVWGVAVLLLGLTLLLALFYRREVPVAELEAKYFTPESRYIPVMDSRMHVRIRGEGPPVLLVHGSFSSLQTWTEWEDTLLTKFTTVSMDLPGHGLTGPNQSGIYSIDYYSGLLLALADTLRIDTLFVAGNSMGGAVALSMAAMAPERVRAIVLVDAAWGGTGDSLKGRVTRRPLLFRMLANEAIAGLLSKVTPRFLFKMNMKQVYGDPALVTDAQIDRYYDLMLREGNRAATLRRLRQRSGSTDPANVLSPSLILWGEKDRWIPLNSGYRLAEKLPDSRLVAFPGAGHVPQEEIPGTSAAEVMKFLESLR